MKWDDSYYGYGVRTQPYSLTDTVNVAMLIIYKLKAQNSKFISAVVRDLFNKLAR